MTSEVRVLVADLAESCRAVKVIDPNDVPCIVLNRLILTGDQAIRDAAFRLFADEINNEETSD